jgi:hypothetical protein
VRVLLVVNIVNLGVIECKAVRSVDPSNSLPYNFASMVAICHVTR